MSFMDRIKALFSGASADADGHAGHDHSATDHSHEPVAPPMPPADPAGMPTFDIASDEGRDRLE